MQLRENKRKSKDPRLSPCLRNLLNKIKKRLHIELKRSRLNWLGLKVGLSHRGISLQSLAKARYFISEKEHVQILLKTGALGIILEEAIGLSVDPIDILTLIF